MGEIQAPHEWGLSEHNAAGFGNPAETIPPLVSVIIPCYNAARYLVDSIESALVQTHPRIEVIVVDDGSADETSTIARSYPVTYLYQENRGVSGARNKGILNSQGKYVLFLDADDRLLPEAVATGVRLLEDRPECALAVGEHRYIAADGAELRQSNKHPARGDHYLMLLESNFIEAPCSALHRRSSLSVTGVFDENLRVGEDWELYLRTARRCSIISHDAIVSEYRQHDSNVSRNAELMLSGCRHVLQMELPFIEGDRAKLRLQQNCLRFVDRRFGRHLARELIRDGRLKTPENRRKLKLLRRHYAVGFVAVVLSRFLPPYLVRKTRPAPTLRLF
jgi:hypothetical protein